jgi:hypothetical protein
MLSPNNNKILSKREKKSMHMIYVIVSFNPTFDFGIIRLSNKEISDVSYKKFDTLVLFEL